MGKKVQFCKHLHNTVSMIMITIIIIKEVKLKQISFVKRMELAESLVPYRQAPGWFKLAEERIQLRINLTKNIIIRF